MVGIGRRTQLIILSEPIKTELTPQHLRKRRGPINGMVPVPVLFELSRSIESVRILRQQTTTPSKMQAFHFRQTENTSASSGRTSDCICSVNHRMLDRLESHEFC
jgi:hypothetical protein